MQDSQMQAMPIDEVLAKPQVLVDYYIRLSANKYIVVAKAGQNTPLETLNKYRAKNVDRLYVLIEDYIRLLQGVVTAAGVAVASKTTPSATKLTVLKDAMSAVYEESMALGFNETTFSHAKLVNHATLSFIETNPSFADMVSRMAEFDSVGADSVRHAMMVSMIATMIGLGHDWNKPATIEKLALGGFLHDFGKTKLPEAILMKPVAMHSSDDRIIYQSHAEIGAQMLRQLKTVPDDIALIVLEHHELSDGTGFPRGLKDFQISPLARVVSLANAFSEIVMEETGTLGPQTAHRALEMLEFKKAQQFNKDAMRALRRLVKGISSQAA